MVAGGSSKLLSVRVDECLRKMPGVDSVNTVYELELDQEGEVFGMAQVLVISRTKRIEVPYLKWKIWNKPVVGRHDVEQLLLTKLEINPDKAALLHRPKKLQWGAPDTSYLDFPTLDRLMSSGKYDTTELNQFTISPVPVTIREGIYIRIND